MGTDLFTSGSTNQVRWLTFLLGQTSDVFSRLEWTKNVIKSNGMCSILKSEHSGMFIARHLAVWIWLNTISKNWCAVKRPFQRRIDRKIPIEDRPRHLCRTRVQRLPSLSLRTVISSPWQSACSRRGPHRPFTRLPVERRFFVNVMKRHWSTNYAMRSNFSSIDSIDGAWKHRKSVKTTSPISNSTPNSIHSWHRVNHRILVSNIPALW